jgi:hypothetical protein
VINSGLTGKNHLTKMSPENHQERQKLIILTIVGLLYSVGVAYFFETLPTTRFTSDLFHRWYASRMLLTTGRSLYDWTNAYEVMNITHWWHVYDLRYYYPAFLLLFTGPLSMIPYELAHVIWTVFGLWCLWLGMAIFARQLDPGLSINHLTLLLVLMTTSVPALQHTLYAQFNTIGILALALTYRALCREQYLLAGVCAGGLLFKPQATILPLFFFLAWSILEQKRRIFWIGLVLTGITLWGMAEMLEPGWVIHFWRGLDSYVPIQAIVDRIWNPHQIVSLTLVVITAWFVFRLRHLPAGATRFGGLLAWTISLNALIIPMYGMFYILLMGPVFIILLDGLTVLYPPSTRWIWMGTVGLFVAGILAFVIPLLVKGPTGLQVSAAEIVYRFAFPTLLSLASLPLIFNSNRLQSFGVV